MKTFEDRITEYDATRKCYRVVPDAKQGEHIQRLGRYEDKDECKLEVMSAKGYDPIYRCGNCKADISDDIVTEKKWEYCPHCGQRLQEV